MQKLAEICIERPVFAAMIILSMVVVGASSYFKLGVDRFPSVDLPTVGVRTTLPGASPEETESLVSQRIEEVVNTVEGITELRSISGQGTSLVLATFDLNRDVDVAAQDVRDRVSGVVRDLPEDVLPPTIFKFDNDSQPVVTIAVSADREMRELTELADKRLRVVLERAPGVGEVRIVGGVERAISIGVDADRLAAYKLPITVVRDALRAQNADVPGGNVDSGAREMPIRTMGRIDDPAAFENLVIATVDGAPVRIRDIGTAEDGTKEVRSFARLDGKPTVTLEVRRQSGANTVAVIDGVKKALATATSQVPPDVRIEVIQDQSRYIDSALHEINTHLIMGSILACLVVFAFMRSWRSVLIAGVAIPASVVSTFGMMAALDFTLNSVTMLALVLMVGVVIDDAIVVLENIFRFVEEKKLPARIAAREATRDIGLAVLATTFSLVVIFVPVSFMSSISGRFLYQFGITAAVAILVSLIVSFTLTPMMSSRLFASGHESKSGEHSREGFYGYIDRSYTWLLGHAIAHRWVVVVIAVSVMLSAIPLYGSVRQEYAPSNVDEGEFNIGITGPEGTSVAAMNEAMLAVEEEVRRVPGVRLMLTSVGGGFLGGVNSGGIYVRIAPHEERVLSFTKLWNATKAGNPLDAFKGNYSQRDVTTEVRKRLRKFTHLRASVRNVTSFNFGGGPWDIDFVLRGPDIVQLAAYADQLRTKVVGRPGEEPEVPGIADADTTLKLDKPELRVTIDRERAADLGVRTSDIATALRVLVGGDDRVTRYRDEAVNDDYDVELRLVRGDRGDAESISRLTVPSSKGGLVQLSNLVQFERATAPSRIDRLDRQRQVSLRGSVGPGYALADRLDALRDAARSLNMPETYSFTVSGKGRELERTFKEFLFAFALSVAFMYMILASQFESLVHPITILLSIPLSIPFALFGQWLMSDTLNLYSALGILVLFGVVKKNSILQIDHMNTLRRKGMERLPAIMQGNRDRLRPILMTTLTLVAGMLPLALGTGPGAEERRSVAIVVIAGQSLSLLLTLIVTPVAYSLFDDIHPLAWGRKMTGRLEPITEVSTPFSPPTEPAVESVDSEVEKILRS